MNLWVITVIGSLFGFFRRCLLKFGNSADADINITDSKPGRIVDNSGDRKSENSLKIRDSLTGPLTVYAVGSDGWQGRIGLGNSVKLFLHLADFGAGGAYSQVGSRPG